LRCHCDRTRGNADVTQEQPASPTYPSRMIRACAVAALSFVAVACASATPPPATAHTPEQRIELAPVVVSPYTDAQLASEFERAPALLMNGKDREAADAFDRLARLAPDGVIAPPTLYDSGLAHEELGERETALERYGALAARFPKHELARGAQLRIAR